MKATRIEHFSRVQGGHVRLPTINPLDTFLRVESLLAHQVKEVVLEQAAIPLEGHRKVAALPLLLDVGRAPCQLLYLVLVVR